MPRIIVTGGTGFIGSHIATRLTEDGHEVIVTGTKTEQMPKATKYMGLNIDFDYLQSLGKIDACFHQAANNDTLDMDRQEMYFANVKSARKLFYNLYEFNNCRKFVYASSCAVYGNSPAPYIEGITKENPLNPYGESKWSFDKWSMTFAEDASVIGLRYSNVYGPGEAHKRSRASMIYQLVKKIANGAQAISLFKHGEQKRDWVYIQDVVEANLKALEFEGCDIFNCGSGKAVSFNDLMSVINQKMKTNVQINYIDCPFKEAYQDFTQTDMSKAKELLGFSPSWDIETGIEELIKKETAF